MSTGRLMVLFLHHSSCGMVFRAGSRWKWTIVQLSVWHHPLWTLQQFHLFPQLHTLSAIPPFFRGLWAVGICNRTQFHIPSCHQLLEQAIVDMVGYIPKPHLCSKLHWPSDNHLQLSIPWFLLQAQQQILWRAYHLRRRNGLRRDESFRNHQLLWRGEQTPIRYQCLLSLKWRVLHLFPLKRTYKERLDRKNPLSDNLKHLLGICFNKCCLVQKLTWKKGCFNKSKPVLDCG